MEHISDTNLHQIEFSCLEALIEKDNSVRFIDAFVDKLDLKQMYFVAKEVQQQGRPSFNLNIHA